MIYENPYKEVIRYIENANDALKLAGKDGKFFVDQKYVRTACGTAYSGILVALDILFDIKNLPKQRGRESIDYYRGHLSKLDKKLLDYLNSAYNILHLDGYYSGERKIDIIKSGIDSAVSIMNALKPYSKNGIAKK